MSDSNSRLLSDEPSDRDEFGSHLPVAKALAEIIKTERGGRAVALIGAYGSGKSTVIRLLRSQLATDDNREQIKVFTFDAWAHQGDPLRRSFLQELYRFLREQQWIGEHDFDKQIDELAHRHETSTATPQSVITWSGLVVIASVPVAAISAVWIEKVWWASIGVLAPLLIAAFYILIDRLKNHKHALEPEQIYELFRTRPREIVHMATVKNPDPTSVEFRAYFDEVASRVLDAASISGKNRRLVIVLDNLDRLKPDDAMALFATMRTFFDPSSPDTQQEKALEPKLWLIVPFDRGWLNQLSSSPGQYVAGDNAGRAFLDKSFQVRLDVADPILAAWHAYLNARLQTALPKHQAVFETICLLYERAIKTDDRTTPRAIKQFVNRLVISDMLCRDTVPLATQAAYLLLPDTNSVIEKLRNRELLGGDVIALLDDADWEKNIASLVYNISPNDAQQVLLSQPILAALTQGKEQDLAQLARISGFGEVCQGVILDNAASWAATATPLAEACYRLSTVGAVSFGRISQALLNAFYAVQIWKLDSANQAAGLVQLLATFSGQERMKAIRRFFSALPGVSEDATTSNVTNWLRAVLPFITWAREQLGDDEVRDNWHSAAGPRSYLALLEAVSSSGASSDIDGLLLPRSELGAILTVFMERFRAQTEEPKLKALLHRLAAVPVQWPFEALVGPIVADLQTGEAYPRERTARYLEALIFLAFQHANAAADQALQRLATDGYLLHHMSSLGLDSTEFGRALLPYWLYGNNTEAGNATEALTRSNQILANPDEERFKATIQGLTALLEQGSLFARLFDKLRGREACHNAARLLFYEIRKARGAFSGELATIFINNYGFLTAKKPPDERVFLVTDAVANPEFDAQLKGGFAEDRSSLYVDRLLAPGQPPPKALIDLLLEETKRVDTPMWVDQLRSFGVKLQIVLGLLDRGCSQWLEDGFRDALDDLAKSQLEGKPASAELATSIPKVLGALEATRRSWLLRDIADRMEDGGVHEVIKSYGQALIDCHVLSETSDRADRCARHVLEPLLRSDSADEFDIAWAIAVLQSDDFAKLLPDPVARGIARQIGALLENQSLTDEVRDSLREVSRLLPNVSSGTPEERSESPEAT